MSLCRSHHQQQQPKATLKGVEEGGRSPVTVPSGQNFHCVWQRSPGELQENPEGLGGLRQTDRAAACSWTLGSHFGELGASSGTYLSRALQNTKPALGSGRIEMVV